MKMKIAYITSRYLHRKNLNTRKLLYCHISCICMSTDTEKYQTNETNYQLSWLINQVLGGHTGLVAYICPDAERKHYGKKLVDYQINV